MSKIVPFRGNGSFATNMVRRMRNTFLGRPLNSQQMRDTMRRSIRSRARRAGGRAATLRRTGTKSSAGVLGGTNADMRSIYRRKPMPKYKKKRWIRFVKKVNAVADKELGLRTVLFNDQIRQTNVTNTQSTLTLALYSIRNASIGYLDDMQQLGAFENEGDPTAAAGDTISINSKIMFQSAVMDITIRNTTDRLKTIDPGNPLLNTYEAAPDAAIELDIYEVIQREVASDSANLFTNLTSAFNSYDDKEIGGAGTGIEIQNRGATPFEFGAQMGRHKIKILKKTKFFIPNGQTITWQVRDPKRRTIHYGDLRRIESYNHPGWTKQYYLVYKLVPGLNAGTAIGDCRTTLSIGLTRKYSYKVEGFNEPRERLIGNTYSVAANA